MRHAAIRLILIEACLLVAAVPALAQPPGHPHSPLPNPAERAAFQQAELARHAAWWRREGPAEAATALQDRYDATYYRLFLDLRDIEGQWIYGDLTAKILVLGAPLDTLLLNLRDSMRVDSLFVNGAPASFTQLDWDLTILPPAPLPAGQLAEVRVFYQGHPSAAGFGAFGWWSHNGIPIIWSLSEPDGAREWWPCKDRPDDKADSLDMHLQVPAGFTATSNGMLVESIAHPDGSRTFHWEHRYPITTYLVCCTATNYERIVDHYIPAPGDTMLVEHFVYPEHRDQAFLDFSITPAVIAAFVERFGPYPFLDEKYGHTIFPWGGGMEHQTNTSYGAGLIRGDHYFDWILVHELSHQWWGDMTSPADWRDIWLNEGFASYCEALWYEHLSGYQAYKDYMTNVQYVQDPSGPIYDPVSLFDSNTVYNKGAWVCHMLRGVLSEQVYFSGMATYRARTAYRSTTTAEFQSIMEEVSGQDLDWFFQPWLYGINRPHYAVSFFPYLEDGLPSVAIHLDQTQQDWAFFPMPVDLRIDLEGGGSVTKRLMNDPDHLDVEYALPAGATNVAVDPDNWILKEVEAATYTLNITTTDIPDGLAGNPYQVFLHGRGGQIPYSWSAVDSLPPGLALDGATGELSGAAPDSGVYLFTVRLSDLGGGEDRQHYQWTVAAVPADTGITPPPPEGLSLTAGPVPGRAWINFTIRSSRAQSATLELYDLTGRIVRVLWQGPVPNRMIPWDGRDEGGRELPSGIYLARLRAGGEGLNRRVVLLH